ncbi:MAG TPA: alpha-2-macroglobulin family protein, partial [Flavisolibacter sp.]|nr:alpha-2-macroglobulin family protein [Flavisolibacter sp.]
GQATVAVEEYKRPKFYVGFDPVKETYKVNDVIMVTGFAKAYAGNQVDNAKVVYRVVRQPRFLYPWVSWRGWLPQAEPMEIAHGEVITDKDGRFQIRFTAIPDNKIDTNLDPVFDYRIYTDITDGSGETRSAENLVSAGYKSLLLKINLPEVIESDSLSGIALKTENMNGVHQQAMVTMTMHVLIPEPRLLRKRYWEQPDLHVMSKQEFQTHFPHDPYRNEGDFRNWEKGAVVLQQTDSSRINGQWPLLNKKFAEGIYVLEFITRDKEGKEVKDVRYLQVINTKTKELGIPSYLLALTTNPPLEPGDKASILIGSSATDLFLIQEVDQNKENEAKINYFFHSLNNGKKTFDRVITEEDRGGIGQNFLFVKHNRFYHTASSIQVPWSNKELDISFTSFRDKILPGSTEKWEVKLSGKKGQFLVTEMLAGMYDASLDQFLPHAWQLPSIWPLYNSIRPWQSQQNFAALRSQDKWVNEGPYRSFEKRYDHFVFNHYYGGSDLQAVRVTGRAASVGNIAFESARAPMPTSAAKMEEQSLDIRDAAMEGNEQAPGEVKKVKEKLNEQAIQIRKNFNETAFFFPDLKTDANGNIIFSFTAPEALTQWKLQTLAHTKEGAFGFSQQEVVTQKELMVRPNAPRFLRQGDRMELSVNVVNLSGKEFTGQAELQLVDAATNQSVDGWFQNIFPNQYFTVAAGSTETVKFPIEIPFTFNSALVWRVVAKAGNLSDGEEAAIPVLSNKMLVTETMPLPMRGTGTKNFSFEKLIKSNSPTLQHHGLTVEFTSNPSWYAVQALPYLIEQDQEHAEQIWNRYYANALALKIANSAPRIHELFQSWKTKDTAALLSNLQKNEELKAVLLAETPWVLEAKTEAQQKQNISLLFDIVRMSGELKESLQRLQTMQSPNGGFI